MKRVWIVLMATSSASWAAAGTLSGRVTDPVGAGVHPVDIDVYQASNGALVNTPDDSTNAMGYYSIQLPTGQYNVVFKPYAGSHLFERTFLGVSVGISTTLNASLLRGQYLTGRVTDTGGHGVALADVAFQSASGSPPANVQDHGTDATGNFTTLVTAGVWDVSLIAPTSARLVPRLIPGVNLNTDQGLGTVVLEPGHLVQGTVTDQSFFPIFDADVDVRPAGTRTKLYTPSDNTDAGGNYAVMLPSGTFDISAAPPSGEPYANATARSIAVSGDRSVPNLALPPGYELRGRCQDPGAIAVAGVDVDVDSLPLIHRLETDNDFSDGSGNFSTLVSAWKFRVTLSPPVATKLIPVRFDSIQVSGARDLGTITFPRGHWVSGTVVESGSNAPIAGANLDFIRLSNGQAAITPGDDTDASGFFRVVTDGDLYRLRVVPPGPSWDTLVVNPFRSLNDTTVTLVLTRRTTSVPPAGRGGTRLSLASPWPNPASGDVSVSFAAAGGQAELSAWDLAGRRVALLYRGDATGTHSVRWDGRGDDGRRLPAGLYYLRLSDGRHAVARRLALFR